MLLGEFGEPHDNNESSDHADIVGYLLGARPSLLDHAHRDLEQKAANISHAAFLEMIVG